MTTSTGRLGSMPSGLVSLTLPPPVLVLVLSLPDAQASRIPTAGIASTPTAAARRRTVRRDRSDLPDSPVAGVSGERVISSPRFRVRHHAGYDRRSATRGIGCARPRRG